MSKRVHIVYYAFTVHNSLPTEPRRCRKPVDCVNNRKTQRRCFVWSYGATGLAQILFSEEEVHLCFANNNLRPNETDFCTFGCNRKRAETSMQISVTSVTVTGPKLYGQFRHMPQPKLAQWSIQCVGGHGIITYGRGWWLGGVRPGIHASVIFVMALIKVRAITELRTQKTTDYNCRLICKLHLS